MDYSDRPGLRVLVAEDNYDAAETLARLLRRGGHAVRVATDGHQAVADALDDPPDVVLVDIGLPRLDGWEVARRIQKGLGQRPCLMIAVTGYDHADDRVRSRQAGIHLHLTKPVDPGALGTLLDHYDPPALWTAVVSAGQGPGGRPASPAGSAPA